MGGAGGGGGVGGGTLPVARMERSEIRGDWVWVDPRIALRSIRATGSPCMAGNSKFALAEWPEPRYTAPNRDFGVPALTSGVRTV